MIDRIVDQLARLGVKTVNLGGNEPIFTNGIKIADTLLPYIIESLDDAGIIVGLTTSGDHAAEARPALPARRSTCSTTSTSRSTARTPRSTTATAARRSTTRR